MLRGVGRAALKLWPFVLVIALWQAWVSLGDVERIVAPTPLEVARDIWSAPGLYASDAALTVVYSIAGLVLGLAVGITIAVLCWFSSLLRGLLTPGSVLLQSVPLIAIVPIMAVILGYEPRTVVGIAALLTFFPTFVFVTSGLRTTPTGSEDLFRVLGSSRATMLAAAGPPLRDAEPPHRPPVVRVDRHHRGHHR